MAHVANGGSFKAKDWTGFRAGILTAIEDTGKRDKRGNRVWMCKCDCGKTVEIPAIRLRRVKSCGCLSSYKYSYADNTDGEDIENIDGEEWRPIRGHEVYYVSNNGRIKSTNYLAKGVSRLLSPETDAKGYLRISLWDNKRRKTFKIHRLVAEAFLTRQEGKDQVNHKDGDKKNNKVDNLEWVTAHENVTHAYKNGLKENNRKWAAVLGKTKGKEALAKAMDKHKTPIEVIEIESGVRTICESQKEAARLTGIPQPRIWTVINRNKQHEYKGYEFRYYGRR